MTYPRTFSHRWWMATVPFPLSTCICMIQHTHHHSEAQSISQSISHYDEEKVNASYTSQFSFHFRRLFRYPHTHIRIHVALLTRTAIPNPYPISIQTKHHSIPHAHDSALIPRIPILHSSRARSTAPLLLLLVVLSRTGDLNATHTTPPALFPITQSVSFAHPENHSVTSR
jgi:hypothetical protein